ncbi:hypothetical protein K438DRAFT_1816237 [Mycena galopus ATCC 62051]|nr:hypothetical protein K438DRAFT_1816237 [Mycena galopus ATCC 62051]
MMMRYQSAQDENEKMKRRRRASEGLVGVGHNRAQIYRRAKADRHAHQGPRRTHRNRSRPTFIMAQAASSNRI